MSRIKRMESEDRRGAVGGIKCVEVVFPKNEIIPAICFVEIAK